MTANMKNFLAKVSEDKALAENRDDFRWAFREVMKKCQREGADMEDCANRAAICAAQPKSADLTAYRACTGE
jgi:hypothetical protein